jgi:hypothetical protein
VKDRLAKKRRVGGGGGNGVVMVALKVIVGQRVTHNKLAEKKFVKKKIYKCAMSIP